MKKFEWPAGTIQGVLAVGVANGKKERVIAYTLDRECTLRELRMMVLTELKKRNWPRRAFTLTEYTKRLP